MHLLRQFHVPSSLKLYFGVCYTGGMKVGSIVAAAAAKFMTPVTLEVSGISMWQHSCYIYWHAS